MFLSSICLEVGFSTLQSPTGAWRRKGKLRKLLKGTEKNTHTHTKTSTLSRVSFGSWSHKHEGPLSHKLGVTRVPSSGDLMNKACPGWGCVFPDPCKDVTWRASARKLLSHSKVTQDTLARPGDFIIVLVPFLMALKSSLSRPSKYCFLPWSLPPHPMASSRQPPPVTVLPLAST